MALPKAPGLVALELAGTTQGAAWLIGRWEGLGEALERRSGWTEAEEALAFDLLGVPADRRDPEDDGDAAGLLADRRGLVTDEVARLATLRAEVLDDRDDRDRAAAEAGHAPAASAELRRLRRYEAGCHRRMQWALAQFRGRRPAAAPIREVPAAVAERPAPAPVMPRNRRERRAEAARRRRDEASGPCTKSPRHLSAVRY